MTTPTPEPFESTWTCAVRLWRNSKARPQWSVTTTPSTTDADLNHAIVMALRADRAIRDGLDSDHGDPELLAAAAIRREDAYQPGAPDPTLDTYDDVWAAVDEARAADAALDETERMIR